MQNIPGSTAAPWVETHLIAGPPNASPPLIVAVILVALSIAAPFVFVKDGSPSVLLGITAVAVALAGMITMVAAVRAQVRRRADRAARRRVSISRSGITLHPTPHDADNLYFDWDHIDTVQLQPTTFIVHAEQDAPKPGRYGIRFGKLFTPRSDIITALAYKPTAAKPTEVQEPL